VTVRGVGIRTKIKKLLSGEKKARHVFGRSVYNDSREYTHVGIFYQPAAMPDFVALLEFGFRAVFVHRVMRRRESFINLTMILVYCRNYLQI
jgi:hypothetical protein